MTVEGLKEEAVWEGSATLIAQTSMTTFIQGDADNYMLEDRYFGQRYFVDNYFPRP